MAERIQQSQLRNDNARIMRRVADGESFTVTVHGHEVADLVPHDRRSSGREFVPAAEWDRLVTGEEPGLDAEAWQRELSMADALLSDAAVDVGEDPWERRVR